MFWTAMAIFIVTLILIIWQPRQLPIGYSAVAGAIVALCAGVVSFADVWTVTAITWNATVTFVGLIVISLILDEMGFFEWSALHMAHFAQGNGTKLFIAIITLGAIVSALFANDGAALILTPIVIAIMRSLNLTNRAIIPFIMASGFIADSTSLPFVISNLTNIIAADYFDIGFVEYANTMVLVNFVSFAASLLVLYLVYRKWIPRTFNVAQLKKPQEAIYNRAFFRRGWFAASLLIIGYLLSEPLHFPVSLVTTGVALYLIFVIRKPREMLVAAPWQIVIFSIGLYVVVYGLQNVGFTDLLANQMKHFLTFGPEGATVAVGGLTALLSAVMNNLPTIMIQSMAVHDLTITASLRDAFVYANVVGANLGPKMTPIGSLATLIWLHLLAKQGIVISWRTYMKHGVILTVPVLFVTLIAVALLT